MVWWRVYAEACRRGVGTAAVRTVVLLGDGAEWIWHRARHFLCVQGVEVVEILDIYHAYGATRSRSFRVVPTHPGQCPGLFPIPASVAGNGGDRSQG